MGRIRAVFALLAVALLLPVGLIVQRALASLAVEREVRHRAVAERVFDEMERELSRLLRREEERPFGEYRFYYVPGGAAVKGYAVARSPLAAPPEAPFVAGYFEIDPDGRFHSPRVPRDREQAQREGDWSPSPDTLRQVAELESIVRRGLRLARAGGAADEGAGKVEALADARASGAPAPAFAQAPGTTRKRATPGGPAGGPSGAQALASAEADLAEETAGDYRALLSLNRGAEARQERRSAKARSDAIGAQEGGGLAEASRLAAAARAPELETPAPAGSQDVFLDADAVLKEQAPRRQDVAVGPMDGTLADAEHLILQRTVLVGNEGYRQGLVLRVPALTRWLDEVVLAGSALAANAARYFFLPGEAPPSGEGFVYVHRFAEPFGALALQLSLAPLPEVAGSAYVYTIAVLLLVSGSAGLFALYRMVAVRLRFAERRSNFAAAVSHELKTPLTAIRMYAEMLRDGMVGSEEKRREYYDTITAESERLSRLIDNVLEFSRLEQGTRAMDLVVGPIGPVVDEAARLLEPHAREVGFTLRVEVEADLPPVRFDRDAVLQVVVNLVDNALKYARDAGDRVIDLRCTRAGDGVAVSVRDRGPGVPARQLGRIFEPFYRGENELTRRARGTGIGLALVRGLAERMGAAVAGREPADGGLEVCLTFRAASAGVAG